MAKCSVIKFKHLVDDNKLNAESFKPEYIEVIDLLSSLKTKRMLEDIINILVNGDEIRTFVEEGLLYLRVSDIEPFFIKLYNVVKIPKNSKIKRNIQLEEGDILISRSGTIGISAIVTSEIKNAVISSHIIRLSIKKNTINSYYLCAFLNSKYGFFQILKKSYGGVVPEISQDGIKKLIVFEPSPKFQTHIEQLVKQAYEKRKLAEQKYQQAEELLYKLLGITKEEIEKLEEKKGYETNFKNIAKAFRFDAEYYHPKYFLPNRIFDSIGYVSLGNTEYFKLTKGVEVGSDAYCDKKRGILFLRVSNLSKEGLKINPSDKFIFEGIYEKLRSKYEPKKGEILISKDGTVGLSVVVDSNFPSCIISGGIVRISIKKYFDPYYLVLVLNSIITELQVKKEKTGAVIEHLRFSKLKEIKIPLLSSSEQQKIAKLVREYFELRKEARSLIKQAIKEVEEEIEKSAGRKATP